MFAKLLPILIITSSLQQLATSFSVGIGNLQTHEENDFQARYVELAQALKYGDNCSWEGELIRQQFKKIDVTLHPASRAHVAVMDQMMTDIVNREYKLCSPDELLVCDKESQKCVCGDYLHEAYNGVNRSQFILEGTGKCRWNTDTYCVPEEMKFNEKARGFTIDSKCKTGTICKTGDGEVCSIKEMFRYMEDIYGDITNYGKPGSQTRMNDLLNGRICSCVADANEIEVISTGAARPYWRQ